MGSFYDGVKFAFGFLVVFLTLSFVYAIGLHYADEIMGGNFVGNYSFNGKVDFSNATVEGLNLISNSSSMDCNSDNKGLIRFNDDLNKFEGCDGVNWLLIDMTEPICPGTTFTDSRDSEVYTIAEMQDGKCWMTENLRYSGNGAVCYQGSDCSLVSTEGRFYLGPQARTACPTGWHIATVDEFATLLNTEGGAANLNVKMKFLNTGEYQYVTTSSYGWTGRSYGSFWTASVGHRNVAHTGWGDSTYYVADDQRYNVRCVKN